MDICVILMSHWRFSLEGTAEEQERLYSPMDTIDYFLLAW
jgi:hypothetical protein